MKFGKSRRARVALRFDKSHGAKRPGRYRIPLFELLEQRELLTGNTFTPSASVGDSASATDNNLRSAIAAVNADASGSGSDTIQLSSGTYTLSLGELQLINTAQTITIEGQGSTGPNATIIDQTALDRAFQINAGVTVIFEDLEITGGTATNDGAGSNLNAEGGGILNHGDLTLTNVAIIGNEALGTATSDTSGMAEGGGIYSDGSLTIQGTTPGASLIENNSATTAGADFGGNASGGGIYSGNFPAYSFGYYSTAGNFQITGTTIAENTAQAGAGSFTAGSAGGQGGDATGGGAILIGGAGDVLDDDTIMDNQAIGGAGGSGDTGENGGQGGSGTGGGVAFTGAPPYQPYWPFYPIAFTAASPASIGVSSSSGAVFNDDTFSGNTAQGGAGGAAGAGAAAGSGGDGQGGAISTLGLLYPTAGLSLLNGTVYGNNALGGNGFVAGDASGGGIDNAIASLSISSSTITANTAQAGTPTAGGTSGTATGGGIENDYSPAYPITVAQPLDPYYNYYPYSNPQPGDLTIDNTIDAGNTAADAPDFYGAATSTDHNLIGDGTDATGFSAADGDQVGTSQLPIAPLLGPLQNNGGSTATQALLPGSPALGAGDPTAANSAGLSTDQRGLPRIVDGAIDIGAVETQQADGLEIVTTDSQGGSSLAASPGSATPGTAITYTIVISNTGPNSASGASIVDNLPGSLSGATYTAVATGDATGFTASGSGSIDDANVDLPVGSTITYTVQATLASSATGTLVNTATMTPSAASGDGALTATDTDTLSPQVNLAVVTNDNQGGWSGGVNGTVAPGQAVTYTIVVSNSGPSDAVGASIVGSLPSSLTGVTFTAVATGGATGFTASGTGSIDDTDVNLPANSIITYTVEATVDPSATGTVAVTTSVSAPAASGTSLNNVSATETDNIVVPSGLTITETDNAGGSSITNTAGSIAAGSSITYTVVVSNLGPSDQSGVAVQIPTAYQLTGATYTATATGGATGFTASGTGMVQDSGIDMPAGSTITYTVTANVPGDGVSYLNNTVYASSPAAGSYYNNQYYASDRDTVTLPPQLEITNTPLTNSAPGQTITYAVTVTNPTASEVSGATVADPLPGTLTGATYTATQTGGASGFTASGSGSIDDTDVDMPEGSTITYTVTATIASSATGTLTSTATVTKLPGGTVNNPLVTGLNDPQSIAVSGDDLFVVNTSAGTIGEYTTSGAVVNTALITGLTDPEGIVISGGNIFVTSAGNSYEGTGTIGEYTMTGAVINASLVSGLNSPVAIAASGDDLFVTDDWDGSVGEYTTSGAVVNASLVTGAGNPGGIAVSGNDLFIANSYGSIAEYDSTTGALINASLVQGGSTDIAATADGDLFFTRSDGTIGELTAAGAIVDPAVVTGLSGPEGIAVSGGNIFVTLMGSTAAGTGAIAEYAVGNNSTSATATETLTPESDVTVTTTDNLGGSSAAAGTAAPGQAITYTIVVSNTGPSDAIDESVVDPLPSTLSGATFTATATGGATGFTASGTGNIDDTDLDLPGGSTITYTIEATVGPTASGTLSNTTTVTNAATTLISNSFVSGMGDASAVALSGGDLFVFNNGTVSEYNATTGAVINASLVTGLDFAQGIAVSGNDLYVTSDIIGTIGEYNATTGAAINASLITGLSYGSNIAVSGNDLYVSNNNSGTIGEYDATTGAVIDASFVTGVGYDAEIAVSGHDLYVASTFTGFSEYGVVGEYNATTGATINASLVIGLSYPDGIEISGGNLYVANDNTIGEYNATTGATINTALVTNASGPFAVSGSNLLVAYAVPQIVALGGVFNSPPPIDYSSPDAIYDYATVSASATDTDTIVSPPVIVPPTVVLSPTQIVDLSGIYNLAGITDDGATFSGGLDSHGNALSESNVGTSQTWNGVGFNIAPVGASNVVQAIGQTVDLTQGSDSQIDLLATGVNGNQANQTFTILYTDGSSTTITQSISDWHTPQGYAGESVVLSTPYRNTSGGGADTRGSFDVYGYSIPVDPTKTIASITLPNDKNVEVLAITAVASVTAPTSLTVTAASSTEADLSWTADAAGTATGYNVYRGTTAGGESTTPLNSSPLPASATSFADTTAVAGNTYFYVVRAVNAPALSAASNEASLTLPASGNSVPVDLADDYNLAGITAMGVHFSGGLDGDGNSFSAAALGGSQTWNGMSFNIASAGANNVVQAEHQTIALPGGSFAAIDLLATGVNGNQANQTFTIHYTDGSSTTFTQSISDWHSPQDYAGESVILSTSYRNTSGGGTDTRGSFDVYGYSIPVDPTKTVASITLPNDKNVEVLAITTVASVAAPSGLSVTAASSTEADLSWTTATGTITGYNVYRGTIAGGESTTPLNSSPLPASATSFADTTAIAGNTYFYVVRAINAPVLSAPSNEASLTLATSGTSTPVDLSSDYNLAGITATGAHFSGGLDRDGNSLSAAALGTSQTWDSVGFNIATADTSNVIQADGQTVGLPQGSDSKIDLLATGVNGNQTNQTFTIHYTDGTSTSVLQSISDWNTPQHYAGESIAVTTSARNTSSGGTDSGGPFDVYGYSIPVNPNKTISSITLPNDKNVEVLAITAAS